MKLSCLPLVFFLVGLEFFAEGEKESTRDLRRGQWQNFGAPVQILKIHPKRTKPLEKNYFSRLQRGAVRFRAGAAVGKPVTSIGWPRPVLVHRTGTR